MEKEFKVSIPEFIDIYIKALEKEQLSYYMHKGRFEHLVCPYLAYRIEASIEGNYQVALDPHLKYDPDDNRRYLAPDLDISLGKESKLYLEVFNHFNAQGSAEINKKTNQDFNKYGLHLPKSKVPILGLLFLVEIPDAPGGKFKAKFKFPNSINPDLKKKETIVSIETNLKVNCVILSKESYLSENECGLILHVYILRKIEK